MGKKFLHVKVNNGSKHSLSIDSIEILNIPKIESIRLSFNEIVNLKRSYTICLCFCFNPLKNHITSY